MILLLQGKQLDALKKMWVEGEDEHAEALLKQQHQKQIEAMKARHAVRRMGLFPCLL